MNRYKTGRCRRPTTASVMKKTLVTPIYIYIYGEGRPCDLHQPFLLWRIKDIKIIKAPRAGRQGHQSTSSQKAPGVQEHHGTKGSNTARGPRQKDKKRQKAQKTQTEIAETLCFTRFSAFRSPKIKENLRKTNAFQDF